MKTGRKTYIRIGLLAVAVCLSTIGVTRGEALTVFVRAINICLECIGLG